MNEKLIELIERGGQASSQEEYMRCQIEIANVVSDAICSSVMPVAGVSAAPVIMILEAYARSIRKQIGDDDALDAEIAELQQSTSANEYTIAL